MIHALLSEGRYGAPLEFLVAMTERINQERNQFW